ALLAAGVEPEQRVALLLPDGVEFVACFVGAMKIGAVPVPLNTLAPPQDLAYYLANSRARALITTPELAARATAEPDAHSLLKAIFLVGAAAGFDHPLARSYDAALVSASPALEA